MRIKISIVLCFLLVVFNCFSFSAFAGKGGIPNEKSGIDMNFNYSTLIVDKSFKNSDVTLTHFTYYTNAFLEDAETFEDHYYTWHDTKEEWLDLKTPPDTQYIIIETLKADGIFWIQYVFSVYDTADPKGPAIYTWTASDYTPPYGIGYHR